MQRVIKRDGREVEFDKSKIIKAISCANKEIIKSKQIGPRKITQLANIVEEKCSTYKRAIKVEDINDLIEDELISRNYNHLVRAFIQFRYNKELIHKSNTTDETILTLINLSNEEIRQENANKNPTINSTQRDYIAGEVSKDITRRILLPSDIIKAHDDGLIHFHDSDYFVQKMFNCCLVGLDDMLQNGTVVSGTMIEKPHSFATACNIATQIVAQVSSNQYGGQSISLTHLAPFVDVSRKKIREEVVDELSSEGIHIDEAVIDRITEKRVRAEVKRGVQTIQYQVNTLLTTNGQSPFITVFMYLNEAEDERTKKDLAMIIEETLKQRYQGVKNEKGVWVTTAFPKLIYVLEDDNAYKGSEYYYLTELAVKCSAKRLVPDYISEKVMKELKGGYCFPVMGCRSALSVWKEDPSKFYQRFNKGVVTISLPDVACSADGPNYSKDMKSFWKVFDERLELCHRALLCRYDRLKGTVSDVSPIHWQHGALARLRKGETIDKLLVGGYSTISLGYAGLWECVKELTGEDLTTPVGQKLGLEIMQHMNDKCDGWNEQLDLGFGIYGTPMESTTYKFARALQKRFGEIPGVSDRNFITNSYHVHVEHKISPFEKLAIESKFQALSKGGAISYIESANLEKNLDAMMTMVQFIYENIMYAEINTKSDYCHECGWDHEIEIVEDEHGKLIWKCPNCGNTNREKMNIARRVCGYISTNDFNQGRTEEIKNRVIHLDNTEDCCCK